MFKNLVHLYKQCICALLQAALDLMSRGHMLADVVAILGEMDYLARVCLKPCSERSLLNFKFRSADFEGLVRASVIQCHSPLSCRCVTSRTCHNLIKGAFH